jgi:DNA-binding transcriptional MocR family regulator
VQGRTDLGTSPLLQRSIARFFEEGLFEPHLAQITAHYLRKRDRLVASLEEHCRDFVTWTVPTGGFFVWLTLKSGEIQQVLRPARDERVAFLPGPYFAVAAGAFRTNFRLSYGEIPEERLAEGISRLGRALERGLVRG